MPNDHHSNPQAIPPYTPQLSGPGDHHYYHLWFSELHITGPRNTRSGFIHTCEPSVTPHTFLFTYLSAICLSLVMLYRRTSGRKPRNLEEWLSILPFLIGSMSYLLPWHALLQC